MPLRATLKNLAIRTNLYRSARWLDSHLKLSKRKAHLELVNVYRRLIPPGSLCFDVGANIGAMSAALLESGARVISFEPNPTVLPELHARCAHHPSWTCVPVAIGREAGSATFYERKSHAQSGLLHDWEGEVIATRNVPVIPLDAALRDFGLPHYCKIDVEGGELQVLEGLTQPIPLLSFEFHLNKPADIQKTIACLRRLHTFGPAEINLTNAEQPRFQFPDWVELGAFAASFPDQVSKVFTPLPYGDIWIRFPQILSTSAPAPR
jgi:FkbM family methyltransferase